MLAWIRTFASRIHASLFRSRTNRDFKSELEAHLASLTEENLRRGLAPEEARRAARIRLGGLTQLTETNHDLRGLPLVETLVQDIRYALHVLRKNPAFTAVAVLTLALGIGANTAIFAVVYAVLLKPLPYAKSDEVFNIFQQQTTDATGQTGWSCPNFVALREQNHGFSHVPGAQRHQLTLNGRGEPLVADAAVVTPEFFSVFDVKPLAGRAFLPEEGKAGTPTVVILGENLWRGSLGADPNIVGTAINLDKRSFTVIGIMPAAFRFPLFASVTEAPQVWIPLEQDPLFGACSGAAGIGCK